MSYSQEDLHVGCQCAKFIKKLLHTECFSVYSTESQRGHA